MIKIWRMKHFSFDDFEKVEGVIPAWDNSIPNLQKHHIEEFVCRVLDPLWESWNRYCTFKGMPGGGICIRTGYVPERICEQRPDRFKWYNRCYTVEIYPANECYEEFFEYLRMWVTSQRAVFDEIEITGNICKIIYKDMRGNKRKYFKYTK